MAEKSLSLIVTIALGVVLAGNAWGASPSLVNIGMSTQGDLAVLNATLLDGFNEDIFEAIQSGVTMTFTFHIELRKEISFWGDSLIASDTIRHSVKYDTLKKVYRFSERGNTVKRKISTRKNERFKQLMLTLENIPVIPIYKLDPEEQYYLRVKAELEADRLWFPFNYILFFLPIDDFETSWEQSNTLSIDPEYDDTREAFNAQAANQSKAPPKALDHVIRSFKD